MRHGLGLDAIIQAVEMLLMSLPPIEQVEVGLAGEDESPNLFEVFPGSWAGG
ncbi:hypothetical protein HS121_15575 [bacterium]|nr:hypothetical protein [bacterium]